MLKKCKDLIFKKYKAKDLEKLSTFENEFILAKDDISRSVFIYNFTILNGLKPSTKFYSNLLDFAIKNSSKEAGENIWNSMEFLGNKPEIEHLIQKIQLYSHCLEFEKAVQVLEDIKKRGFELNLMIFHSILEAFSLKADDETLVEFFKTLLQAGLVPTEESFAIILKAKVNKKDPEGAVWWYRAMTDGLFTMGLEPSSLTNKLLLKATCYSKYPNVPFSYLKEIPTVQRTIEMYEILMRRFALYSTPQMCELLIQELETANESPSQNLLEYMIACYFRHMDSENALRILKILEDHGYIVSPLVFHYHCRYLLKNNRLEEAIDRLNELITRDGTCSEASLIDFICYVAERSRLKLQSGNIHTPFSPEFPFNQDQTTRLLLKWWNMYQPFRYLKYTRPVRLYRSLLDYFIHVGSRKYADEIFDAIMRDNGLPTYESTYNYAMLSLNCEGVGNSSALKDFIVKLDNFIKLNEKRLSAISTPLPSLRTLDSHALLNSDLFKTSDPRNWLNRNPKTTLSNQKMLYQIILSLIYDYYKIKSQKVLQYPPMMVQSPFYTSTLEIQKALQKPKRDIKNLAMVGRKRFNEKYLEIELLRNVSRVIKEHECIGADEIFLREIFIEKVEALIANK
jgi:hypothetical protein